MRQLGLLVAVFLNSAYYPAFADGSFSSSLVTAFIHATLHSPEISPAVHRLIGEGAPLESIAANVLLASTYQCTPELRPACFDAIEATRAGRDEETIVHEWGEWDGLGKEFLARKVSELLKEAAARGFRLLTDAELAAALLSSEPDGVSVKR